MFVISNPELLPVEDYVLLNRAAAKHNKKKMIVQVILRLFYLAAGAFLLWQGFQCWRYMMATGDDQGLTIAAALVMAALAFVMCFGYQQVSALRSRSAARRAGGTKGELRFENEKLRATRTGMNSEISYLGIQFICRRNNCYLLFVSDYSAVIADTAYLTEGDPAAFQPFLEEKTGLTVQNIK